MLISTFSESLGKPDVGRNSDRLINIDMKYYLVVTFIVLFF